MCGRFPPSICPSPVGTEHLIEPMKKHRIRDLTRSETAATTPEYAVILFAVVAIMIASIGPVSTQVSKLRVFEGGEERTVSQSYSETTQATEFEDKTSAPDNVQIGSHTQLVALLCALAATGWLLVQIAKRGRTKKPQQLELPEVNPNQDRIFEKRQQILRVISNNRELFLQGEIQVRHLASTNPITVPPQQTVDVALQLMEESNEKYLLVCNQQNELLGLVSEHYLKSTQHKRVGDAMTQRPFFVSPDTLLSPTVTQMLNSGVFCVAVVEEKKVVGILTTTDIQLMLQVALQTLATTSGEKAVAALAQSLTGSPASIGLSPTS